MTRLIFLAAVWLFSITGGLGVLSVAIILITAFLAAVFVHLGSVKLMKWVLKRQVTTRAIKEAEEPSTAWLKLKFFETLTKRV
jgi:hypothetical protein